MEAPPPAGKNADDIGNQCGGWTIDWQGKSGDVTTGGTTILTAIRNSGRSFHAAPWRTVGICARVKIAADGKSIDEADVKWIVSPYDEYALEEALRIVLDAKPNVLNHNTETIARLYRRVRPDADYQQSLILLRRAAVRRDREQRGGGV